MILCISVYIYIHILTYLSYDTLCIYYITHTYCIYIYIFIYVHAHTYIYILLLKRNLYPSHNGTRSPVADLPAVSEEVGNIPFSVTEVSQETLICINSTADQWMMIPMINSCAYWAYCNLCIFMILFFQIIEYQRDFSLHGQRSKLSPN